jgi:Ca2+-binding RTX toxin-like protein
LPFEGIPPLQVIYVSPTGSNAGSGSQADPLKTIQEAVNRATPGTTIMVEAGTYVETVKFDVSGLPDAPICLVSADGPGAAKIVPDKGTTRKATIAAFGEENIVISGFDVSGAGRLENAIQFGMNGTDFTDMTANIVIKDNIVHDAVKDGIKVSQGDNVYVVDNTVSNVGDQGIDFVAVNNSVIARNDVSYVTGSAPAIFAKAGSTNVLIAQNHVAHAANDGIAVGGWSNSAWMRPGFTEWQAKNVTVIDNHVEDVGKRPLNILGAQDCQIIHNWLESNPDYYYVVTIAPDNSTPPLNSKNILLKDNTFDRGDHWLQILPGQDVGLQIVGNRFDNVFAGATGPHSGDLDYDLAWLPNNGDRLFGTAGNDRLDGGDGADTMIGGAGNDTYLVDNPRDIVEENLNGGTDTVISSATYALGAHVENLTLRAGAGAINATGNEFANVLTGNEANNVLDGGLGIDRMNGGKGNDTYHVDNVKDVVTETVAVSSGGGVDTVYSSVDFTLGTNVDNLVLGGSGKIGTGNALKNQIAGNDSDNNLSGLDGSDTLSGGAGADTLIGGVGLDSLVGGTGDDTYGIDNVSDRISEAGGDGIDTVRSSVTFSLVENGTTVQGAIENLTLTGSKSISATGNALANLLVGNSGANAMIGNGGNDTLDGGAGNDNLIGGAGNDRIIVSLGNDVVRYTSTLDGHDVVVGFDGNASNGQDVLNLDALFDSLNVGTAARAARVSLTSGTEAVDVHVDVSALGNGSNVITVATLQTVDVVTVGQDVLVGTA